MKYRVFLASVVKLRNLSHLCGWSLLWCQVNIYLLLLLVSQPLLPPVVVRYYF